MTDDQLADAWDSFAEALHYVPMRREARVRMNEALAAELEKRARQHYEYMRAARQQDLNWSRGIRPGIFGFGITL